MTFWENKPASKQKNEPITVKQNNSNTTSEWHPDTPEWLRTSGPQHVSLQKSSGGSGGGGNSGRNVYIGDKAYGYDTARVKSAEEMSALMGGYNYNEAAIRSLFDKATKAEYAAKRAANQGAQRQFATNMGDYITTLSDTMRQQLNQAVATGGSRGLAAAQAMQAAQDASLKTVDEATKLTEDAMALDFEEAAAYAQNAKDAEALRATRQQNLMNFASGLYDIDERTTVGAMSAAADAWGSKLYGVDAAGLNLEGTKYNADANKATEELVAKMQSDDNLKSIVANLINSGALTPNDAIAQMFGVAPGSLKNPPQNNGYYGGGYGGSYGGGYGGGYGGSYGNGGGGLDNVQTTEQAFANYNKYLMAEARGAAIGAIGGLSGWDAKSAEERYEQDKAAIYDKATEKRITFDKFKTWIMNTYHGTEADAKKFWESWGNKYHDKLNAKKAELSDKQKPKHR